MAGGLACSDLPLNFAKLASVVGGNELMLGRSSLAILFAEASTSIGGSAWSVRIRGSKYPVCVRAMPHILRILELQTLSR